MENCPSLAALHGYLSGDGYVIKNSPTQKQKYYNIGFRNTEERLLQDFQEKFESIFMEIPHISKNKDRCSKGSRLIYEFFTDRYGSFYSREWSVPEMSIECKAVWLRAFFDCEGWVLNIPGKNRHIGLDSVNHSGLRAIAEMLNDDFGIETKLHANKGRDTLRLVIYGRENLVLFGEKIGFLHTKKRKKFIEALASFDSWKWHFPTKKSEKEKYTIEILKEKIKFRQNNARMFSRKENLEKLQKILRELFRIESKIIRTKNGLGTTYHYLSFYGREDLERLKAILYRSTTTWHSQPPPSLMRTYISL